MAPKWHFRLRIILFATLAPRHIDGSTGDPIFLLDIQRGPDNERFDEILIVGYFLNTLLILDVKFANLAQHWRHLSGRDDW